MHIIISFPILLQCHFRTSASHMHPAWILCYQGPLILLHRINYEISIYVSSTCKTSSSFFIKESLALTFAGVLFLHYPRSIHQFQVWTFEVRRQRLLSKLLISVVSFSSILLLMTNKD